MKITQIFFLFLAFPIAGYSQIDFTAIQRGREQANRENQQDIQRNYDLEMMRQQNERLQNELTAEYFLSKIPEYRQSAIAAGTTPAKFWSDMGNAILADSNFQSSPNAVKLLINKKFVEMRNRLEPVGLAGDDRAVNNRAVDPYGDAKWQHATKTGESMTGGSSVIRCDYKTSSGHRFSINSSGACQPSVEVDPVTNKVKADQYSSSKSPTETIGFACSILESRENPFTIVVDATRKKVTFYGSRTAAGKNLEVTENTIKFRLYDESGNFITYFLDRWKGVLTIYNSKGENGMSIPCWKVSKAF